MLIRHIEGLEISQGQGVGERVRLFPWERRFLRGAFEQDVSTAALSVARGNGKSTLLGAVAAATVDGPLVQRRAETVVVASSFSQSRIIFEHVLAFLRSVIERDGDGGRSPDRGKGPLHSQRSAPGPRPCVNPGSFHALSGHPYK